MTKPALIGRMTPFMLEFLSDNQEGLGATASLAEFSQASQTGSRGFQLTHKQLAC